MASNRKLSAQTLYAMDEIPIREMLQALLLRKEAIALVTLACVAAAYLFTYSFQREDRATATVAMRFLAADKELYPSGRPFAPTDIVAPLVLGQVVEDLGLEQWGIRAAYLQQAITVEPLFREEKGPKGEVLRRIPNYQFRLQMIDVGSTRLPSDLKRRILGAIVERYRESKAEEFLGGPLVAQMTLNADEFLKMDYPLIDAALRENLSLLLTTTKRMADRAPKYHSARHARTFKELNRFVLAVQDAEFTSVSASIRTYRLTRDKEQAIMRYRNAIADLELTLRKTQEESLYARGLLTEAQGLRDIRLTGAFPMGQEGDKGEKNSISAEVFARLYTSNLYPRLVSRVVTAGVASIDARTQIQVLQSEIEWLSNDRVDAAAEAEVTRQVDADLRKIVGETSTLATTLNDMMLEYYNTTSKQQIAYTGVPRSQTLLGDLRKNTVVAGGLGFTLSILAVLLLHFWAKLFIEPERDRTEPSKSA